MESVVGQAAVPVLSLIALASLIKPLNCLDLTPRNDNPEFKFCTTNTGANGRCVDWSYCNEKYEVETGGIITDSELRIRECTIKGEWCCSEKNVTKPLPPRTRETDSTSSCIVTEQPNCPWCVKLYRDGSDRRRRESGFFCMGTLIGTRVVLTTASCVLQAQAQNLWAQIPNSPNPNMNYTVKFRLSHSEYNSGIRKNDLALLTIDPEPEWNQSGPPGACLALEPNLLMGECLAAGINTDENIVMTPLIVATGNCGRGPVNDSSCGFGVGECIPLSIVHGSPIMCRPNDGPYIMAGLAKSPCTSEPPQSLLNNLSLAGQWLTDRLKGIMALMEKDFIKLSK